MDDSIRPVDNFFLQKNEPVKSCLQALRIFMLAYNKDLTEEWKYKLPFYYYKGKMFCFLWIDKKTKQPYIGIMEGGKIQHPLLVQGDRKRIKIFYIDANEDLPVDTITEIFDEALTYYK